MYRVFDAGGLSALTNHLKSTKQTAEASSSAVAELEDDFQVLVQQVAACLEELNAVKADRAGLGVCEATVE